MLTYSPPFYEVASFAEETIVIDIFAKLKVCFFSANEERWDKDTNKWYSYDSNRRQWTESRGEHTNWGAGNSKLNF